LIIIKMRIADGKYELETRACPQLSKMIEAAA